MYITIEQAKKILKENGNLKFNMKLIGNKQSALVFPIETLTTNQMGLVSTKSINNTNAPQLSLILLNDGLCLGYAYANKDYAISVDFNLLKSVIDSRLEFLFQYEGYSVDEQKIISVLPTKTE